MEQIREGWNGGTWEDEDLGTMVHKPVTPEMSCKFIQHSIKELESWIIHCGEVGTEFHPEGFTSLKSIPSLCFYL